MKKNKMKILHKISDFLFGRSRIATCLASPVGLSVPAFFWSTTVHNVQQTQAQKKSSTSTPNANLNTKSIFQNKNLMSGNFQQNLNFKTCAIFAITLIFSIQKSTAQDKYLAKANTEFDQKNYLEAEANYRISGSKNPKKSIASYNLGNAIYRINQPQEAGLAYAKAVADAMIRPEKHQAFHNMGNVAMKVKDYTNAVNAYKQALINNPADDETRYNYALAKKLLKENPPKKDDKKKDDKKKDDKKKEDEKKDKEKKEDKKDGDGKDPKPQPQQPKPEGGGISKQRLENLLDAVNNEEKKVQEKVNKSKEKTTPKRAEKDW